jgi:hypothetical protein
MPITATDSSNAAANTAPSASTGCGERASIRACMGEYGVGVRMRSERQAATQRRMSPYRSRETGRHRGR